MARVILVRHCESEANNSGRGEANSPLSARGRAQAGAVGRAFGDLAGKDPSLLGAALLSSHLARAADTAASIGDALGLEASHDPRLGAGETHAHQYDLADPATLLVVGAEVLAAIAEHAGSGRDPLIVVSHRYPIWALLTMLYGDRGTAIMDELDNLANGDRLEFELTGGAASHEPTHRRLFEA